MDWHELIGSDMPGYNLDDFDQALHIYDYVLVYILFWNSFLLRLCVGDVLGFFNGVWIHLIISRALQSMMQLKSDELLIAL